MLSLVLVVLVSHHSVSDRVFWRAGIPDATDPSTSSSLFPLAPVLISPGETERLQQPPGCQMQGPAPTWPLSGVRFGGRCTQRGPLFLSSGQHPPHIPAEDPGGSRHFLTTCPRPGSRPGSLAAFNPQSRSSHLLCPGAHSLGVVT